MRTLLDRLATWWLARSLEGQWVAFRNVDRKPDKDGIVRPYLTERDIDGKVRVIVVERGSDWIDTLSLYGQPVAAPDLDVVRLP